MKYACLYSIVRFAPFAETEEFANVGIVLSAPAIKCMEYKLATESLGRVSRRSRGRAWLSLIVRLHSSGLGRSSVTASHPGLSLFR